MGKRIEDIVGDRMRVLQILDNLSEMSGVSSMIMNIYRNINRNEVQFDFLVCNKYEQSYEEEIKKLGGDVYYIGNPFSVTQFCHSIRNSKKFFKESACRYDAVHLHSPTIAEFTIKFAKRYGIKNIIIHSHSTMTSPNIVKAIINKILTLRIKRIANNYWACSTEAARFLYGDKIVNDNNFVLVYNAVDYNKFKFDDKIRYQFRKRLCDESTIVITHVSNFSPIKNHQFLVDVIEKTKNKDVIYLFLGDGKCKEKFESELRNRKIYDKCIFVGKSKEVNKYLQASDLVLLPSLKEGLPVTIVEAQASGLDCIVSDTITKEVNVGLTKYVGLNSSLWVNEINKFRKKSDIERKRESEKFKESVFSITKEIKNIERLYKTFCEKGE